MPRLDTVLVVLLAMPAVSFASPGSTQSRREAHAGRRQAVVYREWNQRDAREVAEFERLTSALRHAGRDRMTGRYREVNERVQAAMVREIEQAQIKSAQAMNEARLAGEARRMNAATPGQSPGMLPHDENTTNEERDRDAALARYEEMARLGTMSAALWNPIDRGDRGAMRRNAELAGKFLSLMRSDLAATRREIREDARDPGGDSSAAHPGGR
jgi:hypothetical protein